MESLLLFLATSLVLRIPSPKFKRYVIGNSGCSALLFSENKRLHIKHTAEGDKIYFNDTTLNEVRYGLIHIEMKGFYTLQQAEKILVQYVNRVKKPFEISHNIAMETSMQKLQLTITDYWQDEQGFDWKVKGYTNGKTVAVLYVKNIAATPVGEHDAFLDGFRFSDVA